MMQLVDSSCFYFSILFFFFSSSSLESSLHLNAFSSTCSASEGAGLCAVVLFFLVGLLIGNKVVVFSDLVTVIISNSYLLMSLPNSGVYVLGCVIVYNPSEFNELSIVISS